jgi:hypothetical protein
MTVADVGGCYSDGFLWRGGWRMIDEAALYRCPESPARPRKKLPYHFRCYTLAEGAMKTLLVMNRAEHVNMMPEKHLDRQYRFDT